MDVLLFPTLNKQLLCQPSFRSNLLASFKNFIKRHWYTGQITGNQEFSLNVIVRVSL